MSVPDAPQAGPSAEPPGRHTLGTFLAVILIIIGIVLLLPGACALFFMMILRGTEGPILLLWFGSFAISAGGIWLIVYAFRNR